MLLKYDFDGTVADLPEQARDATLQSLKRTHAERTTMWIGTDKNVVVQITAKDWDAAKELLVKTMDNKRMALTRGSTSTRSQLPTDANYLLIAETSSGLNALVDSLRSTGEALPGLPQIPLLKSVKPFGLEPASAASTP